LWHYTSVICLCLCRPLNPVHFSLVTSNQGSRGGLEFKAGLENAVYF